MLSAIPHDELTIGRLPWVTWSLVAAWSIALLVRAFGLEVEGAGLGVDPGALAPLGFATHWLFSESVFQWLASSLLLITLGPHLEAIWGARVFAGFVAGAALLSAGIYSLLGTEGRPLVGAAGPIAALIAALLTRHGTASVRTYLLVGSGPVRPSFEAPVYTALGLWFVGEVLMTLTAHGSGPTRGPGTLLPMTGACFGVAAALAVRRWDLEAEPGSDETRAHPALAAAQAAREAGRPAAAIALLEPAVRARPQDPELVRALCDAACAADQASRAAEPLRRFVTEQVRLGETASAAGFWRAFGARVPAVRLDPRTALGLAETLSAAGDKPLAARVLRDTLAASPRLSPGIAMRFAEVAAPLHRETALRAGKIALTAEGLDDAKRAKLAERVAALEATSAQEPDIDLSTPAAPTRKRPADRTLDVELDPLYAGARRSDEPPPPEPPSAAFELSADGSLVTGGTVDLAGALPDTEPILLATDEQEQAAGADLAEPAAAGAQPAAAAEDEDSPFGVAVALAAEDPRFHELKCIEAVPLALDEAGLSLRNGPQLDLARVDAIAVAAVHGMAPKPVILVDLLLNWTEISDAPLRTVRLRSDQFDPRTLFPGAGGGLEAFRALLDALHARAGATPLPDADSAHGRPFRMFSDLTRYEREVLQVER